MSAGRARLLETAGAPLRAPALQQARADGPRDLHEEALQEGPKRPKTVFVLACFIIDFSAQDY